MFKVTCEKPMTKEHDTRREARGAGRMTDTIKAFVLGMWEFREATEKGVQEMVTTCPHSAMQNMGGACEKCTVEPESPEDAGKRIATTLAPGLDDTQVLAAGGPSEYEATRYDRSYFGCDCPCHTTEIDCADHWALSPCFDREERDS